MALTDEMRERMHYAISCASLTADQLAAIANVTVAQAIEYKREQKLKILAAVNRDAESNLCTPAPQTKCSG